MLLERSELNIWFVTGIALAMSFVCFVLFIWYTLRIEAQIDIMEVEDSLLRRDIIELQMENEYVGRSLQTAEMLNSIESENTEGVNDDGDGGIDGN